MESEVTSQKTGKGYPLLSQASEHSLNDRAAKTMGSDLHLLTDKEKTLFKNSITEEPFDPKKKFGVIDGEKALIYDNITTSYPVALPGEYY